MREGRPCCTDVDGGAKERETVEIRVTCLATGSIRDRAARGQRIDSVLQQGAYMAGTALVWPVKNTLARPSSPPETTILPSLLTAHEWITSMCPSSVSMHPPVR